MRKLDAGWFRTDIILEPKTKIALDRLCEADGHNWSTVIRDLIRFEAMKRGVWSTTAEVVSQMEPVPSQEVQK
jgi:hypothetical protein